MQTSEDDAREWVVRARRGDLAGAWEISDRTLQRHVQGPDSCRPRHEQSVWRGEPLDGRRVLVRCYHGLGDTIQFSRYLPRVAAVAREVILWAQPSLIPLLQSIPGVDRILPLTDGRLDVPYDVDVEIMELSHVFRSTLETIPRDVPYLAVPPAAPPHAGPRPRVGLAWRAGDWDRRRWIPFELLRPLLDVGGVTWCSVQQHRRPGEEHAALIDVSHDDLHEAARRIAALDLLISVDSMPAHLAGALGVPVWTLLMRNADWRWMEDRADSPWYPTMTLFRQETTGDWPAVISRVEARMRKGRFERGPISGPRPADSEPPG